jgi:hypothetical protein
MLVFVFMPECMPAGCHDVKVLIVNRLILWPILGTYAFDDPLYDFDLADALYKARICVYLHTLSIVAAGFIP